ncbi:hypothetical protein N9B31_06805 [Mariniblastus sp.]|nr:hypothetical protein [bacterium]MDA7903357.1 hypothetical protein [Mariniblastus sp.]
MRNSPWLLRPSLAFATALGIAALNTGCVPEEIDQPPPASPSAPYESLDLSTPQASFETMVAAINSDNHAARLACLTTSEKNRQAGAAALNLMQLAVKSPNDGERFLKLLDNHGLTQKTINRAMASSGSGSLGMPGFTEKIGEKIDDLPKFHDEVSKLAIRPPHQKLVFISANLKNNEMIGQIKIGSRNAAIVFRQVDGDWLIDSPTQ